VQFNFASRFILPEEGTLDTGQVLVLSVLGMLLLQGRAAALGLSIWTTLNRLPRLLRACMAR
jgi:hypothetical protein